MMMALTRSSLVLLCSSSSSFCSSASSSSLLSRFRRPFLPLLPRASSSSSSSSSYSSSMADLSSKRPKVELPPRIGTHNGTFHCDEALGCFLLRLTSRFHGAEIVRTRDDQVHAYIHTYNVYDDVCVSGRVCVCLLH